MYQDNTLLSFSLQGAVANFFSCTFSEWLARGLMVPAAPEMLLQSEAT